ncbi:hypothetical protein BDN67DRAFT_646140 [Paxillus ammoniavirescens]|nr:hypothetical protein BDN67DRAFT_646140 [Paxillus ammoniavirescens]
MVAVDLDPTVDFIAGTAAGTHFGVASIAVSPFHFGRNSDVITLGVVGLLVAHPFDTVKVRFQNPAIYSKYNSTFNAFSTIVREERFQGLYKGVVSPLATCALMNGLVFASYKFFMRAQLDDPASVPTLLETS